MKQAGLVKSLIATSAIAFATLFSVSWSEQGDLSLSVQSAQARRLYVTPYYYHYRADLTGVPWNAVRAYYAGGPWSGVVSGWPYNWDGWSGYAAQNGIGCTPGSIVKGGDGIDYMCQ